MDGTNNALEEHRSRRGKYEIVSKAPLNTRGDLSTFYTPGVARVSEAIKEDVSRAYEYTTKSNTIAIVSDGTRILGLGNIGPEAGLPVMEGKAILFKKFGGVDAIPLCIGTRDEGEIIKFVRDIAPTFGAINLEDIESPKSFRILDALSKTLDIPVFHDDQQGTGVVVLAGLINALKLAGKGKGAKIVVNGAGSAGVGIVRLLLSAGFGNLCVLDSSGLIYKGRPENMNEFKEELASGTNPERKSGSLSEAAAGADVLIGVSKKGVFTRDMISKMAEKPIVFALANPDPEITYEEARLAGAYIVATGSSHAPNQVNNVLAFPSIMRGLLDIRARGLNYEMLQAAAKAIAGSVGKELGPEKIVPDPMDGRVMIKLASNVSAAVAVAAMKTGMARIEADPKELKKRAAATVRRYWKIEGRILKGPSPA
jgi:malate dehydrogenase (oxaloacetate-decarboxylating)